MATHESHQEETASIWNPTRGTRVEVVRVENRTVVPWQVGYLGTLGTVKVEYGDGRVGVEIDGSVGAHISFRQSELGPAPETEL